MSISHRAYIIKNGKKHPEDLTFTATNGSFKDRSTEQGVYRRPYHGITLKKESRAYLMAIGYPNEPNKPKDLLKEFMLRNPQAAQPKGAATEDNTLAYTDFMLTTISHGQITRQQITQTFGDTYIDFFGEQPMYIKFTGRVLNSKDFPWRDLFASLYDDVLQGPKLMANRGHVFIGWDYIIVEGYPLQVSFVENADLRGQVGFSMDFLVSDMVIMNADVGSADWAAQSAFADLTATQATATPSDINMGVPNLKKYLQITEPTNQPSKTKSANYWLKLLANIFGEVTGSVANCVTTASSGTNLGNCLKGTGKAAVGSAMSQLVNTGTLGKMFGLKGPWARVNIAKLALDIKGIVQHHGDVRTVMLYSRKTLKEVFGKWADSSYLGHRATAIVPTHTGK
jgi:hypothetical protein